MKKILVLFSLLFALPAYAAGPHLAISTWQENTNLTTIGKNSETTIQGKAIDLPANQAMNSFAIIFDPSRRINVTKVVCDGLAADFSFQNNQLTIKFPKQKLNNDTLNLYYAYEEKYDTVNKFLRQEMIDIPPFAAGAEARIVMSFPGSLESATLNPNVMKVANNFIYRNKVPPEGVREIIKLTEAQNVWDVVIKVKTKSKGPLEKATIIIPSYFKNSPQKIENFLTTASIPPISQATEKNTKVFKFDTKANEITIENKAKIFTGETWRRPIARNPADYLKISPEEKILMTPLLTQIEQNPKWRLLPLYAKIGEYVHDFIRYDLSYTDKLPPVAEILRNPVGVCTEYARLYNSLTRAAGIPSLIINGGACGDEDKQCKGHAWNQIYVENRWIDVDPTWNLMSGIVSSSHVYFNDEENGVSSLLLRSKDEIEFKMDFEMKLAQ